MKFTGHKLQIALAVQPEAVTLVDMRGIEHQRISARYVAGMITGGNFIGYARNGVVEKVISVDAPRCGPFATRHDVAAVMAAFPRLPHVEKNPQDPGAKHWVPQPTFSGTGHAGKVSTVHFG